MAALERRIARLTEQIDAARTALAEHDQSDYSGLTAEMTRIGGLEAERDELEHRWYAFGELLES